MATNNTLFNNQNPSTTTLRYEPPTETPSHPIPITPSNPLHSLIRRLEAATSRLEDIANSTGEPGAGSSRASVDHNFEDPQQLSIQNGALGITPSQSRSDPELPGTSREASTATIQRAKEEKKEDLPESILAMDELMKEHVTKFVEASQGLDALVEEQVSPPHTMKEVELRSWQSERANQGQCPRRNPSPKLSVTSDASSSSAQKPQSPTRNPRLSWIC